MENQLIDILNTLKSASENLDNISRKDKDIDTRRFLLNVEIELCNLIGDIAEYCGVDHD